MRLAHLIKGLGRGGAEGLLPLTLPGGSGRLEHRVGYFLPQKDALVGELEARGVPVTCFEARSNGMLLARVPAVARWLRRERIDLVHAHLPLSGAVARLAGSLARVPVVYTEHNLQARYHPLTRLANRLTWRLQAQVVAVSDEVAGSIRRHLGTGVPVTTVRNGIDVAAFETAAEVTRAARRELGIPLEAPVVGTVAVFRRQKRLDLWLEAAARIAAAVPAAHFVLVGDGPERPRVEAARRRLDLEGRAHLPGLLEDVRGVLGSFDLFLISSEFEGLPLALLEAMAAGVPVVTTAVGGIGEVIDDRLTGRLVAAGDAAALAGAALELLEDPEARRRLAAAARRRVAESFGIERMAGELEAIYETVLKGRPRHG